jgi:hypothetical protein
MPDFFRRFFQKGSRDLKFTKLLISNIVLGIVAVALVAGFVVMNLGHPVANAADSTPTPGASGTATPGASQNQSQTNQDERNQLKEAFIKNLASQLGVDEAKLNAAYSAAIRDTVDQAVKDGKLTQAQADKIKAAAKNGFPGGFPGWAGKGQGMHQGKAGRMGPGAHAGFGQKGILDAAAKALKLTTAELQTQLKAGKSIADVAKDQSVDLQTVKDAMLAAIKADLDARVKAGKLTQAQADPRYQAAPAQVDKLVDAKFTGQGKARPGKR